ncbi:MAG TPA: MerR family transcriptional regulator [Candidatus Dormibacteraeota bacterium]|nr:MerR family transcriptional regulator [Candidatus Dormibacteraeota bacterium]
MPAGGPDLPDKLYFKIGEVAKIVGVKPYVLRYWETEFSVIRPGKTRSQHRLYRRRDVEALLEIKRLLHNERYTIEGAKRRLKSLAKSATPAAEPRPQLTLPLGERTYRNALVRVRRDLQALYDLLR